MGKVKIAMIGVGAISGIYLKNITGMFKEIELAGVCDLVRERAEKAKEEYGIPKIYDTMHDAFKDPDVDIVLNLTRPYEHFEVTKAALLAGKHVYSEKPLGAVYEEGVELVKIAEEKGLMLGGAPDTFLGGGIQTCRKLIDDGVIGDPVGAACFMIGRGHESWHPDPEFYYKFGGGPMMDMGPYYVTALVNLLGGISGVTGVARKTFPTRTITSQPYYGTVVNVDVNTHVVGILDFDNGAIGTIITTFDVQYRGQARFEVYGSKGTLFVPDPNGFGGPIKLYRPEQGEIMDIPLLFSYKENSRALGLADMAKALADKRDYRASYKQTLHVLEVLSSFDKSSASQSRYVMQTKYTRGEAMKNNPMHGILD
jgi:predicted dehydrogenase